MKEHEWSWRMAPFPFQGGRASPKDPSFGVWVIWECRACGILLKENVLQSEVPGVMNGTFRRLRPFRITVYKKGDEDCEAILAKKVMQS